MKLEDAFPNPDDLAKVREIEARATRASNRIHMEAMSNGDITGTRMAEIVQEEMPHLSRHQCLEIVLAIVTELASAEAAENN